MKILNNISITSNEQGKSGLQFTNLKPAKGKVSYVDEEGIVEISELSKDTADGLEVFGQQIKGDNYILERAIPARIDNNNISQLNRATFFDYGLQEYVGKELEFGIDFHNGGQFTFTLIEKENDSSPNYRVIARRVFNITQKGAQWINPGFGVLKPNQWIGISAQTDTARFYFGATGKKFAAIIINGDSGTNAPVFDRVGTTQNSLGIGIRYKDGEMKSSNQVVQDILHNTYKSKKSKTYRVTKKIDDGRTSGVVSTGTGPYYTLYTSAYRGIDKEIEIGANFVSAGTFIVGLYETSGGTRNLIEQTTFDIKEAGVQWFPTSWKNITDTQFIGVGGTARFLYGGNNQEGFVVGDAILNLASVSSTTALNVGFRYVTGEVETYGDPNLEPVDNIFTFTAYNLNPRLNPVKESVPGIYTYTIPNLYRGHSVELGVDVTTPGTFTFSIYQSENDTPASPVTLVTSKTYTFNKPGHNWVRPFRDTKIAKNQWIAVGSPTDTGKFSHGGDGIGFFSIKNNTLADLTTDKKVYLNLGIRVDYELPYKNKGEYLAYRAERQSHMFGKTLAVTGDSISTHGDLTTINNSIYYRSGTSSGGVYTYKDTYWGMLEDKLGMIVVQNEAWSGSRVTGNNNTSALSGQRSKELVDADVILVAIGTNDLSGNKTANDFVPDKADTERDREDIIDSYAVMLKNITTTCPHSRVIVLAPFSRFVRGTTDKWKNASGITIDQLQAKIQVVCDYYGVEMFRTGTELGFTPYNYNEYLPDALHPNKRGMERIAEYISSKL